jgi:predicted enzyme related to lactoylglutathione lyase
MERAVGFYEKVLGLKKNYEHPVWTSFDVGGTNFALARSGTKKGGKTGKVCTSCSLCVLRHGAGKAEAGKNQGPASSVVYLGVDKLDEFCATLKGKGVRFLADPKEQGWGGRTAIIQDLDDNLIVLSQL